MKTTRVSVRCAALCLLLASALASAQSSLDNSKGERPWARGVPADKQRVALDLFRDGNGALKESLFVKAAQKYREALAAWDHPAIHYNLALVLVNLDQPVETYEHLLAALKYGAQPLDADKFEQAQRYKSLIEKQLSKVEVHCDEPGAQVKLDGKVVFTGPGQYEAVVRSGAHTLVASKEGYLTLEQSPSLPPGELKRFDLKLYTQDDLTQYRRLFSGWIPWAVIASGVAVAGAGVGLQFASKSAYAEYDTSITGCAVSSGGCVPTPVIAGQRSRGDALQTGAFVLYGAGAAAAITGGVLLYVNRLQPYRVSIEGPKVSVLPQLSPGGAGATVEVSF
jgi:hypothetical protein